MGAPARPRPSIITATGRPPQDPERQRARARRSLWLLLLLPTRGRAVPVSRLAIARRALTHVWGAPPWVFQLAPAFAPSLCPARWCCGGCSCSAGVSLALAGRREACGRAAPDGSKGGVQAGPGPKLAPPLPHCAYGAPGMCSCFGRTDGPFSFRSSRSTNPSMASQDYNHAGVRVLHCVVRARTCRSLVVPRQHESNFDRPGETDPSPTLRCGC